MGEAGRSRLRDDHLGEQKSGMMSGLAWETVDLVDFYIDHQPVSISFGKGQSYGGALAACKASSTGEA
jgi:hypothetical protein